MRVRFGGVVNCWNRAACLRVMLPWIGTLAFFVFFVGLAGIVVVVLPSSAPHEILGHASVVAV